MDLMEDLNSLTPPQAESCLDIFLKGLALTSPQYQDLMAAEATLPDALAELAQECKLQPDSISEPPANSWQRTKAVRDVLSGLAGDDRFAARVEAAIPLARSPSLPAGLVTCLVVAGIIILLSTDIKVEDKVKNGSKC
jgi:hypothetical protein